MTDDKLIEEMSIAYNQVLLNQPEDKRNQPLAMKATLAKLKETHHIVSHDELIVLDEGAEAIEGDLGQDKDGSYAKYSDGYGWLVLGYNFHEDSAQTTRRNRLPVLTRKVK